MQITLTNPTVRDLVADYMNDAIKGVRGFGDNLDIRPRYQREFVYSPKQQAEVIHTVMRGLPLNVMYWVDRGEQFDSDPETPRYEVMDGQQRTVSICEYVEGAFAVDVPGFGSMFFANLPQDKKNAILDYELFVYVCDGTDSEKLTWFRTINIAGEKLTDQELRNAVHAGPWVSDAKRYFSQPQGSAERVASDYLKGSAIRQDYLETAIRWHLDLEGGYDGEADPVDSYMARHQDEPTADALWSYFRSVIDWVEAKFPTYRKEMRGLPWGFMYNKHRERTDLDPVKLEAEIARLMADDDVTRNAGAYEYVLDGDERHLSIRAFTQAQKRRAYERQQGICPKCGEHFELSQMQGDHIIPWSQGGRTTDDNLQMLCQRCNATKSDS